MEGRHFMLNVIAKGGIIEEFNVYSEEELKKLMTELKRRYTNKQVKFERK